MSACRRADQLTLLLGRGSRRPRDNDDRHTSRTGVHPYVFCFLSLANKKNKS